MDYDDQWCAHGKKLAEDCDECELDALTLPCCGSESGVHLIGCQSEDALAGRIHRPPETDGD